MCLEPSKLCEDNQEFRDTYILHHGEYCRSNGIDCANQNDLDKNLKKAWQLKRNANNQNVIIDLHMSATCLSLSAYCMWLNDQNQTKCPIAEDNHDDENVVVIFVDVIVEL